jgi:site-specific DNA-methyltransferase (adenine-specific)
MTRALYFGDNLDVLRESIADASVDLVYLDPPFNSQRSYNLLFKSPGGHESDAQITAFEDTWHWAEQAAREYEQLLHQPNTHVAEMMRAFRAFLGENDVMAYLTMMANRLLELHRVLKPTGSLYLHCDPTASHYLKIVLDGVFGKENFKNEIIWKRTSAHSSAIRYGPVHDVLFFYSKSEKFIWNHVYQPFDQEYLDTFFDQKDEDGNRWKRTDLTGAGTRQGPSGEPWRGIDVKAKGRHWGFLPETLDELDCKGRIHWPAKKDGMPRLKQYPEDLPGVPLQDVWSDIRPMHNLAKERLGYPTQKPLALLERIIQASSNEGDVVLDPFCGCGTAVHAAEKLKRAWIGIDITHLAISLIEKRLRDAFGKELPFEVHGTPKDLAGAANLAQRDKYQFQWWACSLVNAQPYQGRKKGADRGIDGLDWFRDDNTAAKKVVVSVKGGEHVSVAMVRDLRGVMEREQAEIGLFVTLAEPNQAMIAEAASAGFYHSTAYNQDWPRVQILTVKGLLEDSERPRYINVDADLGHKRARRETTSHRGVVEMELEG